MGAYWSVFGATDDRSTRQILDTILKRLITETDMRDMYGLADPEICKKFVIFGTKAFNKLFVRVRLNKKPDGTLFFQQLRGLGEQNPDAEEQQKNCQQLAYFYVSIFQIFAAIALSIFDSNMPTMEISDSPVRHNTYKRGVQFFKPSGFKGFTRNVPQGLWGQQGGELPNPQSSTAVAAKFYLDSEDPNVGIYTILNKYLVVPSQITIDNNEFYLTVQDIYTKPSTITVHHNALYEPATGTATGPTPQRTPKNLIQNGVVIKCSFTAQQTTHTVNAKLSLTGLNDSNQVMMKLSDFKDSETKFVEFQRELVVTDDGYLKAGELHFTQIILTQLIQQYKDKNKVPFNALVFLQTHDVLTSNNQIKDSYFYAVEEGKREGDDPEVVQILYAPEEKIKLTEYDRKETVKIKMNLEIARKSTKGKYTVTLHLKDVQAEPSELEDVFRVYDTYERGGYKQGNFTTGQSDVGVPVQEEYNSSIGAFLQRQILSILNNRDKSRDLVPYSVRGDLQYRQGVPEPYNSPKMAEEFRIKEIWKALARDPPIKPHCMARALQLLNLAAIKGDNNGAYSRVCFTGKDKFRLIGDGSLPTPGRPVTDAVGIRALAMLFLNAVDKSADAIKGSEQYREFRIKFKRAFEKYEDSYVEDGPAPANIKDVVDKAMPFCKDNLNQRIALDGSTANQLRSKVYELQNRQAIHVSNAMYILFKLFNEKEIRAGRFELSDYVWEGGTDALAQIRVEARDLLMGAYTDCERIYKDGLYILYNKVRNDPNALNFVK